MSKCVYHSILNIYDQILKIIENKNERKPLVMDKNKKLVIIIIVVSLMIFFFFFYSKIEFQEILPSTSVIHKTPRYLKKIFKSRQLYITNTNLTKEYIRYIRPVDVETSKKFQNVDIKFDENYFIKRGDQLDYAQFGKLCAEEKLISQRKITASTSPLISIIIPSYNKEANLIKSIRSIQNQSFKNIEIIIVDDSSSYKSSIVYKTLLKIDPRIRVFTHLKNMGLWRTRLDGFLYSRGKYIMTFEVDDLYEDNYVLEDLYNLMEKYDLDSAKMLFRRFYDFNNFTNVNLPFEINYNYTEIIGRENISRYNFEKLNWGFGIIWNRITRADVITRGLYLLSDEILNIYKNFCEDQWWNRLIDQCSTNFLIVKRFGYLYFQDPEGQSRIKTRTEEERDRMIQEFILFLYFDYEFLPKESDKKPIIAQLRKFDKRNKRVTLNGFRTKFYILDNLLKKLTNDPYVTKEDKIYVYQLLIDSLKRQNELSKK